MTSNILQINLIKFLTSYFNVISLMKHVWLSDQIKDLNSLT